MTVEENKILSDVPAPSQLSSKSESSENGDEEEESDEEEGVISESGERLVKNEKSSNRFHANT